MTTELVGGGIPAGAGDSGERPFRGGQQVSRFLGAEMIQPGEDGAVRVLFEEAGQMFAAELHLPGDGVEGQNLMTIFLKIL